MIKVRWWYNVTCGFVNLMSHAFDIIMDWKFWLVIMSIIKDFALVIGIVLVKFNDLKHLKIDIDDLKKDTKEKHDENKEKFEKITDILTDIGKAIVEQNVKCNERHGK